MSSIRFWRKNGWKPLLHVAGIHVWGAYSTYFLQLYHNGNFPVSIRLRTLLWHLNFILLALIKVSTRPFSEDFCIFLLFFRKSRDFWTDNTWLQKTKFLIYYIFWNILSFISQMDLKRPLCKPQCECYMRLNFDSVFP